MEKKKNATREIDCDAHRRHTSSQTKNATFDLIRLSFARKQLRGTLVSNSNTAKDERERSRETRKSEKKGGRTNGRKMQTLGRYRISSWTRRSSTAADFPADVPIDVPTRVSFSYFAQAIPHEARRDDGLCAHGDAGGGGSPNSISLAGITASINTTT